MKRVFSILLAISLLAGLLSTAFAEESGLTGYTVVRSYYGSTAEAYAYTYGYKFEPSNDTDPVPTDVSFSDIKADSWYYDCVDYVASNGIMAGTGKGQFSPAGTSSRAMLASVLYRIEGQPESAGNAPFSDVKSGSWYEAAVIWAQTNGVISGYGNGKFGPNDAVTREQAASILYRYAAKGETLTEMLGGFADTVTVSAWAVDAVRWAVQSGILSGKRSGAVLLLDPQGKITRAELASVLMRLSLQQDLEHQHAYTSATIVEPTCTDQGYTKHSCVCGASICDSYTEAKGCEHELSERFYRATPSTPAFTEHYCFNCNYLYRDNYGVPYDKSQASTKEGRAALARAEAKRIAALIAKPGMTETEKAIALGKWLYDNACLQTNQSDEAYKTNYGNEAFAAFFFRCAACSGFSKAMTMLCDAVGLKSQHINQGQWTHQWNRVYCDGKWIIIDAQGGLFGGEHHPFEDNFDTLYAPGIAADAEKMLNNYLKSLGFTGEPAGTYLDEGECLSYGQFLGSSAENVFEQGKELLDHWLYDLEFIEYLDFKENPQSAVRVSYDGYYFLMTWMIE